MANQLNPLLDDENKQVTSTQSGVIGGGTSDAGGAAAGSGWTNLNQYLDANKGAGEQIANAAVGDTANEFASNKSAIDSWSKGLQDQIGSAKQADTTQAQQYSGQAGSAGANFGEAAKQQTFDAWRNVAQNAPKQFEDQMGYQGAYGAQSKIKDNLNLIKDPTNQSKIVADTFRKQNPTYSSGMGKLDTFLATADGGNSLNQKLSGLAGQYSGDYLGDSKNAYGAGVTDLQATMGKNRGDVMGAISNQYNTLKGMADSGVSSLNASQISAPSIEAMNRGATVTGKQNASYADVLDQQKLADLEALSSLSGQQFDASQRNKTFNKGTYNDYNRNMPVEAAPSAVEEKPDINVDYKANPSGTGYIDSRVDGTVNRWKKGIRL